MTKALPATAEVTNQDVVPDLEAGLASAIFMWHEHLHAPMHQLLTKLVRNGLLKFERKTWGSACSGTDVFGKALVALLQHWGDECTFKQLYAAERDTAKQEFIKLQHEPGALFADVADLARNMALCKMKRVEVVVPSAELFTAGFSCTSRSSMNSQRAKFANCR